MTITIRELEMKLAELLNNSGMAIDVIEIMLEKFLAETRLLADRAYAEAAAKEGEAEATVEEVSADELK